MDYVEDETKKAIGRTMDRMTEGMPPRVIMRDRVPEGGYVSRNGQKEIKSREIEFIGLRSGEQMKMLIPLREVYSFVKGLEEALDGWKIEGEGDGQSGD
jgi:hypothetical protein